MSSKFSFLYPEDESQTENAVPIIDEIVQACISCCNSSEQSVDLRQLLHCHGSSNPFPGANLIEILEDSRTINDFVRFIFVQKFGHSDRSLNESGDQSYVNLDNEPEFQIKLELLSQWLVAQKVHRLLISAFCNSIQNASNNAVIRNQTSIHLLDWYSQQLGKEDLSEWDDSIAESLCLVLCDVWSAVRNACAVRLGLVIQHFTLAYLEVFFRKLVQICQNDQSSWQHIEGCLLGLYCIVRKFMWMSHSDVDSQDEQFTLKFGKAELHQMPEFISEQLPGLLLSLLSHPQLSIREHTIRTYTTYLSKCEPQHAVDSFNGILRELNGGLYDDKTLPHKSQTDGNTAVTDAYKAEGLLGVCLYFVKKIPVNFLEDKWHLFFSTMLVYLHHPASTVRQAASNVIKFMVTRDSSNPLTLKRVLQGLSYDWQPDMEWLLAPCYTMSGTSTGEGVTFHDQSSSACRSWEWKEGRLLSYDLLMQFIIKNHWLYTFGPAYSGSEANLLPQQSQKSEYHKRTTSESEGSKVRKMSASSKLPSGPMKLQEESYRTRTSSLSSYTKPGQLSTIQTARGLSSSGGATDINKTVHTTGGPDYGVTPHGRHYSYYTTQPSGSIQSEQGDPPVFNLDPSSKDHQGSLLQACQNLEKKLLQVGHSPRCIDRYTSQMSDPCDAVLLNDRLQWDTVNLETLSDLLERILYQTFESMSSNQWELRRMGYQLLPCLVEVLRWHDMRALEDLWDNQLKSETSAMSYGACMALKHSVIHAARLQHVMEEPPIGWQDHKSYQRLLGSIIEPIRMKCGIWGASLYLNLKQCEVFDKCMVAALEVLMLIHTHFELSTAERYSQLNRMMSLLTSLYTAAHPNHQLAQELVLQQHIHRTFYIVRHNFLSCCHRKEEPFQALAQQVEKYLLHEMEHVLPHFLKTADVSFTHTLLPLLANLLHVYFTSDHIAKGLQESIIKLTIHCNHFMEKHENSQMDIVEKVQNSCGKALQQICVLFESGQMLDHHSLRQLYDIILHLCESLQPYLYLGLLCKSVLTKSNAVQKKPLQVMITDSVYTSLSASSLAPLMNGDESSSSDDEEQNKLDSTPDAIGRESQTLNASVNSGGSGKFSASAQEDEESDWDSWDEEEQESDYSVLLKDFIMKLHTSSVKLTGSKLAFANAMKELDVHNQQILQKLI